MNAWRLYEVNLRLRTPLHAGAATVGNIMRCRPYLGGKAVWGAVTATAALRTQRGGAIGKDVFEALGEGMKEFLRFGYLFPREEGCPMEVTARRGADFDYRFVETYSATAMNGDTGAAQENSLHEIEALRVVSRESPARRLQIQKWSLPPWLY